MIITITLNAALDRTQRIEHPLQVGKLNRAVSSHLEPGGKGINVSRAIKALGGSSIALGFSAGTNVCLQMRKLRRGIIVRFVMILVFRTWYWRLGRMRQ